MFCITVIHNQNSLEMLCIALSLKDFKLNKLIKLNNNFINKMIQKYH